MDCCHRQVQDRPYETAVAWVDNGMGCTHVAVVDNSRKVVAGTTGIPLAYVVNSSVPHVPPVGSATYRPVLLPPLPLKLKSLVGANQMGLHLASVGLLFLLPRTYDATSLGCPYVGLTNVPVQVKWVA